MGSFLSGAKKNWKTSAFGLVGALAVFINASPQTFGGDGAIAVQLSRVLLATGVLGVGLAAQDGKNPPAPPAE
jgi:hypothetical protein